jgi:uncharacterized membrane protein
MKMPTNLQAAATIGVLSALGAAELAGHALARDPGSATLWYLQLGVFGSLRPGMNNIRDALDIVGIPLLGVLAVAILLMLVAAVRRMRLVTGLGCNLALILCAAFLMLWHTGRPIGDVASLDGFVAAGRDASVLWIITALAAVASLSVHAYYIRRAFIRR